MKKTLTIALLGNPNSGKTTVFNAITGARQHTANYPGVTVEQKEGFRTFENLRLRVVDLPGTYSLTAYSPEEIIARRFILEQKPDVVVDVIDSSNLERSLYLAVQLLELKVPLVLAFNMADVARAGGLEFDLPALSVLLDCPIVPMVARKKQGVDELLKAVAELAQNPRQRRVQISYGGEIDQYLRKIENLLQDEPLLLSGYDRGWLAIKLLEGDQEILSGVRNARVLEAAQDAIKHLQTLFADTPDVLIADRRYGFICGACRETVRATVQSRRDRSDLLDSVLIHRFWGLPVFALLMFLVFFATFYLGKFPMVWLEAVFAFLGRTVSSYFPADWPILRSLIVDGVLAGVGSVVVFLPNILLLFLGIALLEDTGYMARAAFIMDRIMHRIGLHGKSFIPMLIGFGCSVPAIMATRILENRRNRLTTILVIPLFSCGARITIYSLIIPAFFPPLWRGLVMWLVYLTGILLAVAAAKLLRSTLLRGQTTPFVMELPPYRMPTLKGLAIHMWSRGWMYLKKAGTLILALSVVLWAAGTFPAPPEKKLEGLSDVQQQSLRLQYSLTGRLGKAIEPAIKPLGFDWRIGTSLIGATVAKELFVSQLGIVYSLGDNEQGLKALQYQLRRDFTPLQGLCVMLFCLVATPCVATIAVTRRESGAWKWAALQFFGLTALAYILTLILYQTGQLFTG